MLRILNLHLSPFSGEFSAPKFVFLALSAMTPPVLVSVGVQDDHDMLNKASALEMFFS